MNRPLVMYRAQIPQVIIDNPVQSVVDGFTILHSQGGMKLVEAALEAVIDVVYSDERTKR